MAEVLKQWAVHAEFVLEVEEWDIANGPDQDLLRDDVQQKILASILKGTYVAILMSPPCGTWSRALWANQFGPRPLRAANHPWGFPWVEGQRQAKVASSNAMIRLCLQVLEMILDYKLNTWFWWEHPEDLGAVPTYKRRARSQWFGKLHPDVRPASIWQLEELRRFMAIPGTFTRAFHQCFFWADSPKPTRFLTNLPNFNKVGYSGWPEFDESGRYQGPLPRDCGCGRLHPQLIAKDREGNFNTTAAAAYPPAMDRFLATSLWAGVDLHSASLLKRVDEEKQEQLMVNNALEEKKIDEKKQEQLMVNKVVEEKKQEQLMVNNDVGEKKHEQLMVNNGKRQEDVEKEGNKTPSTLDPSFSSSAHLRGLKRKQGDPAVGRKSMSDLPVKSAPLQVWYKGKMRRMADGLGKCSPGIRPAGSRGLSISPNAARLAGAFWGEVETLVDSMSREERLKMIAKLSLGKFQDSPFSGSMEAIRSRLDDLVAGMGKSPARKKEDRSSEINFRRLRAWSEIVGDEDDSYLNSLASKGVPLGVRSEIGRANAAYDAKGRDEEDLACRGREDDPELVERDNYISATSHMDKVKEHVEEDVRKGWISSLSLEEARERYGEELQVASLGAVPKDQQWSDVRVVHDGTHGIQVNRRIVQPNKMEFPQFDDLQAALRAFQGMDPVERLLVAFDIKSAHRLIPVQPEDWGFQAFRLDDSDRVYVNRVGTFGITTASFWWGRVAATLFRTFHRVLPRESLIYLLLFADDGLVMVGGEKYHKLALSVFIYLEIMEVPLSWKKTRGGFKTEWIGYTVDLDRWLIGISEKKVRWLRDWVTATNKEGKILGREFKAGIGRMGFLAGAVRGARPFLAPLYAISARVGNTSFVDLHMAVKISLEFFAEWLEGEPMKPPCDPPSVAGEVFRVDAMASDQGIMIGGWETFETTNPSRARWFSIEISRKNSPWLYIRGEPHRTIAASELLAVTMAVILFGLAAKWRNRHGRLVLSGFTDNASNSYLVDKYLSVKFPVSMVLMELSRQLAALGAELQLHWIPREQNEESDNLSKGHVDAFDPKLRVDVDWDNIPFLVIPKLVEHAMSFDKEIQLKKGSAGNSKPAAARSPPEEKLRLRQPW